MLSRPCGMVRERVMICDKRKVFARARKDEVEPRTANLARSVRPWHPRARLMKRGCELAFEAFLHSSLSTLLSSTTPSTDTPDRPNSSLTLLYSPLDEVQMNASISFPTPSTALELGDGIARRVSHHSSPIPSPYSFPQYVMNKKSSAMPTALLTHLRVSACMIGSTAECG